MLLGVVFPQLEIGVDPGVICEYFQTAETLGYNHVAIYDHVLGADLTSRPNWKGPYNRSDMFHDPLVLFGYASAITHNIELVTSVLILGQRQTALVAKQAAEVDILSAGRLRLGVGIGWNEVEYEALGQNFHNRGRREEEQIAVMRALWTQEVVSFHGLWHDISLAGINPLPVQRPVPVWLGGRAEPLLERVGRLADGWFPMYPPNVTARQAIDRVRSYARDAGRNPDSIGIEGRIDLQNTGNDPAQWIALAMAWKDLGATHLGFNTMRAGLEGVGQHIKAISQFKECISASLNL
jgi:probable F420-dependent oxidoreductase